MSLNVAIQMDPIERIRIAGDTGFALMLEAQARGHSLYTYTPDKLSMRDGKVTAPMRPVKVRDAEGGLAWIEKKHLTEKRSVIVTSAQAEVRKKAEEGSPLVFEAEKNVTLEYLEAVPGGWVKVHHRDGQTGFVRLDSVFGL